MLLILVDSEGAKVKEEAQRHKRWRSYEEKNSRMAHTLNESRAKCERVGFPDGRLRRENTVRKN